MEEQRPDTETVECQLDLMFVKKLGNKQRGARKTLPSARTYHMESSAANSKLNRSYLSNKTDAPPVLQSNILNVNIFPVTSTSKSNSTIIDSETHSKVFEAKIKDTRGNDRQIKNQGLFESTYKETPNNLMPSQTKADSSENKSNIYCKRPLASRDFQNIDSGKVFVKQFSNPDSYEHALKEDEISCKQEVKGHNKVAFTASNVSNEFSPSRKILVLNAVLSQPKILEKQNTVNFMRENSKLPEKRELSQGIHTLRKPESKPLKSVRFEEKENIKPQDPNKTYFYDPNASTDNNRLEIMNEITARNERETKPNPSNSVKGIMKRNNFTPRNRYQMKPVPAFSNQGANRNILAYRIPYLSGHDQRNMHQARPMYCVLPPMYSCQGKNVFIAPNYGFQKQSSYRMMGTATRGNDMHEAGQKRFTAPTLPGMQPERHDFGMPTKYQNDQNHPTNIRNESSIYTSKSTYAEAQAVNEPAEKSHGASFRKSSMVNNNIRLRRSSFGEWSVSKSSAKVDSSSASECSREYAIQTLNEDNNNTTAQDRNSQEKPLVLERKSKIQEAEEKLSKLSEILHDIYKALCDGFECPGLEVSLPVWKSELEHCLLSLEKIQSVLCEANKKNN